MANISSINGNPIVPSDGSVGTAQVASGYNLMTDDEKRKLGGVPAQGNTPFSSINGNPIVPSDGSVGTAQIADGSIGDDKLEQSGGILSLVDSLVERVAEIQVQQGGGAPVDLIGYLKSEDAKATYAPKSHKHAMADVTGLQAALDAKASTDTATTDAAGLMSAADKSKLDGIAEWDERLTGLQAALDAAQDAATEEEYDRQVLAGTYQGRSLMTILGASSWADCYAMLSARAKLMDSSGIRIGDYIDVTPTSGTVNRGNAMRYRVAGMGHNYQFGDTACPWAFWMVPDDPIDMTGNTYAINTSYIYWNTTANNNGISGNEYPYLASNLRAWETGQFLPALPTALQNVLVNHRIMLEKRYSSSGALTDSTGWGWADAGKVFSLNEMEVYGCPVWGTRGRSVGEAAQLPLFRDSRNRIKSRAMWWLRSVSSGSSSGACYVSNSGVAGDDSVMDTWVRPRPCFLIG